MMDSTMLVPCSRTFKAETLGRTSVQILLAAMLVWVWLQVRDGRVRHLVRRVLPGRGRQGGDGAGHEPRRVAVRAHQRRHHRAPARHRHPGTHTQSMWRKGQGRGEERGERIESLGAIRVHLGEGMSVDLKYLVVFVCVLAVGQHVLVVHHQDAVLHGQPAQPVLRHC